jgi:hypothetical protein
MIWRAGPRRGPAGVNWPPTGHGAPMARVNNKSVPTERRIDV